ncbi:MAG: hypothetical protein IJY96_06520 [Oscillospiraceae bacterium]|nr:hypothetical protein [Oscillospiraceae bacterium]
MMKKLIAPIILLALALAFIWPAPAQYRGPAPAGLRYEGELGVDVDYSKWKNEVYVHLENLSGETLYAPYFGLERFVEGEGWQFRSYVTPADEAVSDEEKTLLPGETIDKTVPAEYFVERLKNGEYRIFISFRADSSQGEQRYVYYEFNVE